MTEIQKVYTAKMQKVKGSDKRVEESQKPMEIQKWKAQKVKKADGKSKSKKIKLKVRRKIKKRNFFKAQEV